MDCFPIDAKSVPNGVVVADTAGQLAWADLLGERFAQFDYELDLAVTWHPAGRESAVKIDPRIAFGKPVAEGIPTWAIKGRWAAGESLEEIEEDFGISQQVIKGALIFERVKVGGNGSRR